MQNRSIPQTFIKELISVTNIVELIGFRIKLKKKGKNYYAYCPFHSEKTPSFTVSAEKQFFYCFGCNNHGNIIDFLMKYEQINFIDAIKELSNLCGKEIPNNYKNNKNKNLYSIMELLNDLYVKSLSEDTAKLARFYLKKRGINDDTIKKFSIGFADPSCLYKLKKQNINNIQQSLYEIGVLLKNKYYVNDLFKGRITFPIRDKQGKLVGFGGRTIKNDKPKYINSPETKIFNKSSNVFGLYEIEKKYKKLSHLLLVEGYIDVLSLNQFGIKYAVSTLGTSTSKNHIKTLFFYTNNIICCYDGDDAGKNASWNTLKLVLPYMYDGRELNFIFLPKGEDPDSIIRKEGKENFELRIKKSISFSNFLLNSIMLQINISTYNGLVKFIKLSFELINKIPGEIIRIYMRKELGKKVGILDDNKLETFLLKRNFPVSSFAIKRTNMRILIGLLIQNTKLINIIIPLIKFLKKIELAGMSIFIELINVCINNPHITTGQLVELYRGTSYENFIKKLASWDHMISDTEIENVFKDTVLNVYNLFLKNKQEKIIARAKTKSLTLKERNEFWSINLLLMKNK